jgi:WD40 repeat protein/3',5'-cyclic AMP phosphodiesterase CpdA
MTPERAIAQLRRADDKTVGLAFLVGPRHLMTCAHVVNAALGRPLRTSAAPGPAVLRLEFPFGGGRDDHVQLRATVASWLPNLGSFDLHDVAALQIDEDLPAGVAILSLAEVDRVGAVQMWGPADKRQFGGHVSGQLMGMVDKSRFQVDQELRGVFRVRSGFSGGPVWQPSTGKVVGILQASSLDEGATDAYVLGADLIVEARRGLPDPDRAMPEPVLTVLHLSGLRFGARRPVDSDEPAPGSHDPERLVARLLDKIAQAQRDSGVTPNLVAVAGDVAEHAKPAEYETAYSFLSMLRAELRLDLSRLVVVPGRHDVNRGVCDAYFLARESLDEEATWPYWPKWQPYAAMFTRLFGAELRMDQPWQLAEFPELKLAVAGLNSTMAESHLHDDHYGWLGEEQLRWFASRLESAQALGWLRIGVLHHNPTGGTGHDGAHLRDFERFAELIAPRLDAVLHGQPGKPPRRQSEPRAPAVPESGMPFQYRLIEIQRDKSLVTLRRYDLDHRRWIGDVHTRAARPGLLSRSTQVDPTFPAARQPSAGLIPAAERPGGKAKSDDQYHDDLLSRMAEVCRLRQPEAHVLVMRGTGGPGYLHVGVVQELEGRRWGPVEQYPVGACEGSATDEEVDRFVSAVGALYLAGGTPMSYKLVYDGPPATTEVRERALLKRVELLSFAEYQLGYDLRPYARRQAERLARDSAYAPKLYVTQRYTEIGGYVASAGAAPVQENLLERLRVWLADPDGHLVVVLGAFGHGKTFLLRELTRRMHEEGDLAVPVLVHLRDLEKAHDLNQLVAAQLTAGGERRIDLAMFRYLLREGRIALLFDGFDELAVRMTYDAAALHLDKILQAADGRAKVVLASRDHHFRNDDDVSSALGDRLDTVAGRRVVKLADFDDGQIATFLRNRLGGAESASRRLELLRNIKDLLGLSRNPRMLDFITRIEENRLLAAHQRTGEITAAGLYQELLDQWLHYELDRQDRPGGLPPPTMAQFWHAVTLLALRLWGSTDVSVGVAALGEVADELARLAAPESLEETAPAGRDETAHAIGSGTLLVRDSEGRFTFVHQSVMEWLVARQVANRILANEPLPELERREMSPLMVDFLCDLLGRDRALAWAAAQISDPATSKGSRENAALIHKNFGMDIAEALVGIDLRGGDLSGQVLRSAHLVGADLTEAIIVGTDLTGANLEGVSLARARLDRSRLTHANLRNADLTGASLLGADLRGADLTGAALRGTALVGAQVSVQELAKTVSTWGMAPPSGDLPQLQYRSRASGMRAAAAGPDLVAAGGDDGVLRIWDPVTGSQLREWTGHADEVLSLDFTADGRWLASGGAGGVVRIWDAATGVLIRDITAHTGRVWSVGFSADGRWLASAGGDGAVKIWDTETGTLERSLTGHILVVWSVAFSPDGDWLASAGDGQVVRVWDPATGTLAREWIAHASAVLCLAFSPDGMLASAGADGAVRIWDPATGTLIREWAGHDGPVWSLAFSADRRLLASAGDDRVVRVWDPAKGTAIQELTGHTDEVNSVDFSPDGRWLASTGTDRVVRVWDPATGALVRKWTGHTDEINSIGFSPDGQWLAAAGDDRTVRIWNPATGAFQHELAGHTGRVWSMAFSPGGRWLASAGADGRVLIWNPATGDLERSLTGHAGRIRSLRFTPDGTWLASAGDDHLVRIWDPATGTLEREWAGHTGRVRSLGYTADGRRLASGGDDGMIRIWDPATGIMEREWAGQIGAVWAVWFSPDGARLAVGGTVGKISILDPVTGALEREWTSHTGAVSSVAFSPDGRWLVSAGTVGVVRIWDPGTGIERCQLSGHTGAVWSVGFSPDGQLLASAGADSVIRIWDPATGAQRAALVSLDDGWAVLGADLKYKLHGNPTGEFWYVLGLCRFEPGELDPYLPALQRIHEDVPMPPV